MFCIKHKGKLTAEHNTKEACITKGFNKWKKAPEAFVHHQQSKEHRAAITYESVVPRSMWKCVGNTMMVSDLNNKHLAE